MDDIDRALIQRLQEDAGQPYAALAASVGLAAAIGGVSGTQVTVVPEIFFERPLPL